LSVHRKELCLAGTTGDAARFAQAVPCTRRITSVSLTAIAYRGYYAACQRRDIAATRQRTKIGFRTTLLVSVVRWPDSERDLISILR
jgi:hypothetical protein